MQFDVLRHFSRWVGCQKAAKSMQHALQSGLNAQCPRGVRQRRGKGVCVWGGLQKSLGKRLAAVYEILNKIEITLIVWTRAHMLLHPWFFGRGFAKGRGLCVLCLAKAKTISEFDEQILVTRVTTTLEKGGGVIEGVWGATEPPCWCS